MGLAPIECPISAPILKNTGSVVLNVFSLINEMRLSGSVSRLTELQEELERWPHGQTDPPHSGKISLNLAYNAAHGDCLTILGRWSGKKDLLKRGVDEIQSFHYGVIDADLDDGGATELRALACLGNARTRLGYLTRDVATFARAVIELNQKRDRDRFRANNAPLIAWIHRDLGDAIVGRLHWDRQSPIDGSAIRSLKTASAMFGELWQRPDAPLRYHDEWAASQSSLAVALTRTAWAILIDKDQVKDGYIPQNQSTSDKCHELLSEADACIDAVCKAYSQRCRSSNKPGYRWSRTKSNIAFASSYSYQLSLTMSTDRSDLGSLAESAFLSVLKGSEELGIKRSFRDKPVDAFSDPEFASYSRYDANTHQHRYDVNAEGLHDLYVAIASN